MKKWLHLYTEHIRHCMKQEKLRLRQKLTDIRSWFKAKPKEDIQIQPQNEISNTRHKQKTQKLLHRFFNTAPKSTGTKASKAQKCTKNTNAAYRLRTPLHTAYIQTTLRLKQKKSHQAPSGEHHELNLVKKMTHTNENSNLSTREAHHFEKRNTTRLVKARGIKKFTRWRQTFAPNTKNMKHETGETNMGKCIGK